MRIRTLSKSCFSSTWPILGHKQFKRAHISEEMVHVLDPKILELKESYYGSKGKDEIDAETLKQNLEFQYEDLFNNDVVFKYKLSQHALAQRLNIELKPIGGGTSASYFGVDIRGEKLFIFKPFDGGPQWENNPKRKNKFVSGVKHFLMKCVCWWRTPHGCIDFKNSHLYEEAASIIDKHLQAGLVPTTKVATISSPFFNRD